MHTVGDMNCTTPGNVQTCSNNSYGNGGMTYFYEMLHAKLKNVSGRGGVRGSGQGVWGWLRRVLAAIKDYF